jgi:hypothetical protein
MNHRTVHALSFAAGAVPFAFASIRAIQTGWDFRYFLIAVAGLLGAAATVAIGRASTGWGTFAMVMAAFVAAALLSVLAAMTIGTRLGPGLLIVAAAFAACFAAAAFFHLRASGAPATARQ